MQEWALYIAVSQSMQSHAAIDAARHTVSPAHRMDSRQMSRLVLSVGSCLRVCCSLSLNTTDAVEPCRCRRTLFLFTMGSLYHHQNVAVFLLLRPGDVCKHPGLAQFRVHYIHHQQTHDDYTSDPPTRSFGLRAAP